MPLWTTTSTSLHSTQMNSMSVPDVLLIITLFIATSLSLFQKLNMPSDSYKGSYAGSGTQLVRRRVEGQAHTRSQIQVIFWESSRRREAEVLHEGGEKDEELHSGQTLSQTNPAACKGGWEWEGERKSTLESHGLQLARGWSSPSPTCRKRHEGISFDKLPVLVQEVGRVKVARLLPFALIIQDGHKQRIHRRPLVERQRVERCQGRTKGQAKTLGWMSRSRSGL